MFVQAASACHTPNKSWKKRLKREGMLKSVKLDRTGKLFKYYNISAYILSICELEITVVFWPVFYLKNFVALFNQNPNQFCENANLF